MKFWALFITITTCTGAYALSDQDIRPLAIYLVELKPLVYQEKQRTVGPWFHSFEKLKKEAGLEFDYQFVSISRLELLLSNPERAGCSLAILKTKERIEKMKINFIYDHPDKTLLNLYKRADDPRIFTIKNLKTYSDLKIVTNAPPARDTLKKIGLKAEMLFNFNSIIRMLLLKRIDVAVGSNLAIEKMDEFKNKKIVRGPLIESLTHAIGCSVGTPPLYIERLKKATKTWHLD